MKMVNLGGKICVLEEIWTHNFGNVMSYVAKYIYTYNFPKISCELPLKLLCFIYIALLHINFPIHMKGMKYLISILLSHSCKNNASNKLYNYVRHFVIIVSWPWTFTATTTQVIIVSSLTFVIKTRRPPKCYCN